ncbi:MAG: ATP-binding protein [Chitinophagales bacterium]
MYKPYLFRYFTILCLCYLPWSINISAEVIVNTHSDSYTQESVETLEKEKSEVVRLYELGKKHHAANHIESALTVFLQSLDKVEQLDLSELQVKITRKLSSIYQEVGNFELAYKYQLQSLETYEELSDSLGIAKALYEIGNIFFFQNSFELALQNYTKSKKLVKHLEDSIGIYSCLGAIGSVHNRLGNTEKSLAINLQALELAEQMDYAEGIAYALHNVGADYYDLGYCETALDYYQKSLSYKKDIGDKFDEIPTLQSIGLIYLDMSKIEKALSYLDEALKVSETIDAKSRKVEIYQLLSATYEKNKHYQEAFHYMKAHTLLKDSILNENTLKEMAQSKTRYEVAKKEKEIVLLKKENELLGKNKEITSWKNYFLAVLVAFLLFTSFLFFYYYKNQKRYNGLLADKNLQIQQQNQQLEEVNDLQSGFNATLKTKNEQIELQNQKLANSNKELRQFAYIASHDLKEPLRMIGSYTSLLRRRYSNKLDEGAQEFMGFITEATSRMNNLLDDLLTYSKVGTQELKKDSVKMGEIVEVAMANLQLNIKQKQAVIHVVSLPEVKVSRTQMGQLLQNLISNALKFSDSNHPKIWIDVQKNGKAYIFSVKDNGIGIAKEHQERIFEMFSRLHTRQEYEGTGIGLATCKKIVEQHNGKIWVESESNKGSTFYFTIPFNNEEILQNAEKNTFNDERVMASR